MKKIFAVAIMALAFMACEKKATMEGGMSFNMLKDVDGALLDSGDVIKINFQLYAHNDSTGKDTLIQDSRKLNGGKPAIMTYNHPKNPQGSDKFSPMGALAKMSPGDSAEFNVSPDSVFQGIMAFQRNNEVFGPKTTMRFVLSLVEKVDKKKLEAEQAAEMKAMKDKEQVDIDAYIAKTGLKFTKTASGLMYGITTPGNGKLPKAGDTVYAHYTGKLLDGTVFDSSLPRKQLFSVPVGMQQVIKGWDEGLMLLPEKSKGFLLIPSELAYGPSGAGKDIKPFSPLYFEMEIDHFAPAKPKKEDKSSNKLNPTK